VASRRTIKVGVEEINLALVGKFVIGVAELADDHRFGLRRRQRAAGNGRLIAVAGVRHIGRKCGLSKDERRTQNTD